MSEVTVDCYQGSRLVRKLPATLTATLRGWRVHVPGRVPGPVRIDRLVPVICGFPFPSPRIDPVEVAGGFEFAVDDFDVFVEVLP